MYHNATPFASAKTKSVAVNFNGGKLTTDAGALLLQQVDQKIKLVERINQIIHDPRHSMFSTHQQGDLIAQRIFAIALGDEDVNDQNQLRKDPAMLVAVKNTTNDEEPLGSASTLSRLEKTHEKSS